MLKSYKLQQQMEKMSSLFMSSLVIISTEASAVNKLTFQRGILFYDGWP